MLKKIVIFLLMSMFFLIPATIAQANYKNDWSPEQPSPYSGRIYTHNQYVRIFVNDGGALFNNYAIYGGYMPVFCLPGQLTSGYTAVDVNKLYGKDNGKDKDPFTYAILKSTKFKTDTAVSTTGEKVEYFLIHNGLSGNPYVGATMSDTNVEVQNNANAPGIGKLTPGPDGATTKDPYLVKNWLPYSVAWVGKDGNYTDPSTGKKVKKEGFYYATTYLKGDKGGQVGSTNLTADSARALVTHQGKVQVNTDVYINYNYNLALAYLGQEKVAKKPGEEEDWTVWLFNQTPFSTVKDKTHLRAFIQEKGGEPQLVASTEVRLRQDQAASQFSWNFGYKLPEKDFTLIVTVDRNYIDGQWVNEPLVTEVDNIGRLYGDNGAMETTYADNVLTSAMTGGISGGNDNKAPGNTVDLAALNLNIYDTDGNLMADTLKEGATYNAAAVFKNYYNKGGFAEIRLYARQRTGNYQLRCSKWLFIDPGGTIYISKDDNWSFTVGTDTIGIAATIDYFWGNSGWDGEQFNLETGSKVSEVNYENNIIQKDLAVTNETAPREESHYASYYPFKIVREPVYRTEKQKVWLQDWKKLPYKEAKPKYRIHAILISLFGAKQAYADENAPYWNDLSDSLQVYGYWIHIQGKDVLVECNQDGSKTGWAYINNGSYIEKDVQVIDHYNETKVEDQSQPKRYLYAPEVYPGIRYRERTLSASTTGKPEQIGYPYGQYLNKDWRQIVIPIYNPNYWGVVASVKAMITDAEVNEEVNLGAQETKWVLLEIPEGSTTNYSTQFITVVTEVKQNLDPYAPDNYINNPQADDGKPVVSLTDATGLQFSGPEWYKEQDKQKVFVLVPAFKKVMEWIPDSFTNENIGTPTYKTVAGYGWNTVSVSKPYPVDGSSAGGSTLKDIAHRKEFIDMNGYDGQARYNYFTTYDYNIAVRNYNTDFIFNISNLGVTYMDYRNGKYSTFPLSWSKATINPGDTINLNGNFEVNDEYFHPELSSYGGLTMSECVGTAKINAIAGVYNYFDQKNWAGSFEPAIYKTMFDYEKVMTPDELVSFGNSNKNILSNISNFLQSKPELMSSKAVMVK